MLVIDFSIDKDEALIADSLAGCEKSFTKLYERYDDKFRLYARCFCRTNDHLDWESFVNVTWFKFWTKRADFDEHITNKSKWIGWFEKCIRNQAIDVLRRDSIVKVRPQTYWGLTAIKVEAQRNNHGHDGLDLDWFINEEASSDTTEQAVLGNLMTEALKRCLEVISDHSQIQGKVMRMRLLHGLSYDEIGALYGWTRPAVKSALFRGRKNLAVLWVEEYPS